MQILECLYLEDDDSDYETFSKELELALKPVTIKPYRARTPREAYDYLEENGSHLHAFFVDLLIRDTAQQDIESKMGLNVVDEAVKYRNLAIIALSKAERSHAGTRDQFLKRAGTGALYLDKGTIKDGQITKAQLRSEIEAALLQKGHRLSSSDPLEIEIDWKPDILGNENLDVEIGSIGLEKLKGLLRQIAPECQRFTPFFVTPGFSGASVLRIDGTNKEERRSRRLLVKFSTDRNKLTQELRAAPRDGERSANIFVPYLPDGPWEYEDCFSIAARFEDEATTFAQWLVQPSRSTDGTSVKKLLGELFFDGLAKGYSEGIRKDDKTAIELLMPSDRARARILISLDLIEPLLTSKPKGSVGFTLLRDFVRFRGQIGTHPSRAFPRITHQCWSHGDLHSRNILVGGSMLRPWLIDAGNRRECHWATDPARLCGDLWISSWDSLPDSYFWDNVIGWRQSIATWLNGRNVGRKKTAKNTRTYESLVWLRDNLSSLFSSLCQSEFAIWQFHLALAMELLTQSSYPDVPMPKRCLGVLAAYDVLVRLEREIPWM